MTRHICITAALITLAACTPRATQGTARPTTEAVEESSKPAPPIARGDACIEDTLSHAAGAFVRELGEPIGEFFGAAPTVEGLTPRLHREDFGGDLDGDGLNDTLVGLGGPWGTYGGAHAIYLSSGGCSRFAGTIVDGELSHLEDASSSQSVRDLQAQWSNGCAGNAFGWTRYRFDGKRYAVVDEATCNRCEDPELVPTSAGDNTHPVCKR